MFKSIVVGTDGSPTAQQAVTRAADLAKLCNAQLHIVTAFRPVHELVFNPEALPVDLQGLVDPEKDARTICEDLAASIGKTGVDAHAHPCAGSAADALLETAERANADLIVVGNRGMKRRILGSVPNSVAHHAACTVMIVQTT